MVTQMQARQTTGVTLPVLLTALLPTLAATPPNLKSIYPAGGQAGTTVTVQVVADGVAANTKLHCSHPDVRCVAVDSLQYEVSIPANLPCGRYDMWLSGATGISAPRSFVVGLNREVLEQKEQSDPASVHLNSVINGRIDASGQRDAFLFDGKANTRVVLECECDRIDSPMRAVLSVLNEEGRRLAANRGYFGIDPVICFDVPKDGSYSVHVQDITLRGGADFVYRLSLCTGPRILFASPSVLQEGHTGTVRLYGWNLANDRPDNSSLESLDITIQAKEIIPDTRPAVHRITARSLSGPEFTYRHPGCDQPIQLGITDVPVMTGVASSLPSEAHLIPVPCDIDGQLTKGTQVDWYRLEGRRGEVIFVDGLAERIGSQCDLQVGIFRLKAETAWEMESLASFGDSPDPGGRGFLIEHLDPSGRWVCPANGFYWISVQNLTGGLTTDPGRKYRLCLRREEPGVTVVARCPGKAPAALNIAAGGRASLDLTAVRHRGMSGSIRVSADDLPTGVHCPDVWMGPNETHATLVVSADPDTAPLHSELSLTVEADGRSDKVHGSTIVRSGTPRVHERLTQGIPYAVSGNQDFRILADAHRRLDHHLYGDLKVVHSPGSIVDVHIEVERSGSAFPISLIGTGVPHQIQNVTALIDPDASSGTVSFYLPPTIKPGRYSWAVSAHTQVERNGKPVDVTVISNPISVHVQPAAFRVEVDPFAVSHAGRGETIVVDYTVKRINGFIGKLHTELASPGIITDVAGLRGRGVTFVGQTENGKLQIVVNDDAPVGRQKFLRLFTVGVVEDEAVYQGACFLNLEITD